MGARSCASANSALRRTPQMARKKKGGGRPSDLTATAEIASVERASAAEKMAIALRMRLRRFGKYRFSKSLFRLPRNEGSQEKGGGKAASADSPEWGAEGEGEGRWRYAMRAHGRVGHDSSWVVHRGLKCTANSNIFLGRHQFSCLNRNEVECRCSLCVKSSCAVPSRVIGGITTPPQID